MGVTTILRMHFNKLYQLNGHESFRGLNEWMPKKKLQLGQLYNDLMPNKAFSLLLSSYTSYIGGF